MDKSILQSIRSRLQEQLNVLNAEIAAKQADAANLLAELSSVDAMLGGSATAAASVTAPAPVPAVTATSVAVTPKVGAPVRLAEPAREDSGYAQFKARIESTNFLEEIPVMPPQAVLHNAAIRRTQLTGEATVAANTGMRTICKTFLRGESPAYRKMLSDIKRNAPQLKDSLMLVLNETADAAIEATYPWLSRGSELPFTDEEFDAVTDECRALAIEMLRERGARQRAVENAAGGSTETAMGLGLRSALSPAAGV